MILGKIQERVERLPSGGIITDENRWDTGYIQNVIVVASRVIIRRQYTGDRYTAANRRINNVCYQDHYPDYSELLQEDSPLKCYTIFPCPPVISLTKNSDGFRYVGTTDNSQDFKRIHDEAEFAALLKLSKTSPLSGLYIPYWFDGHNLKVYGQNIKQVKVSAIFQNPLDIPTYNKYVDNFPLADDDIPAMEDLIKNTRTLMELATAPDKVSDSSESTMTTRR